MGDPVAAASLEQRPVHLAGAPTRLTSARGRARANQRCYRMPGAVRRTSRILRAIPNQLIGNSQLVPPGLIRT